MSRAVANPHEAFDSLVPNTTIWLPGQPGSGAQVGARGYSLPPYELPESRPPLDAYVLVLYVGGETQVCRSIGGAEERRDVRPGDLSLVSPRVAARWGWASTIDVLHVYFDPSYLRDIAIDELGAMRSMDVRDGLRITDVALAQMGLALIDELRPPRAFASTRSVRAIGERMAIQLLRRHFDLCRADDTRAFTRTEIAMIRALVDARLADAVNTVEMADALGLDAPTFRRAFRSTFGQSPHAFVRAQRLEQARELLMSTSTPISQIAIATGFADQSHLTRQFKRRFGSPPAALRQRRRRSLA